MKKLLIGLLALGSVSTFAGGLRVCGAFKDFKDTDLISWKHSAGACLFTKVGIQIKEYGKNAISYAEIQSCIINLESNVTKLKMHEDQNSISITYAGTGVGMITADSAGRFIAVNSKLILDEHYTIVCTDTSVDVEGKIVPGNLLPGNKH